MESSGEVGKINLSQSTYDLVKEQFACKYRGEIEAKGKGKLGMYFVSLKTEKNPKWHTIPCLIYVEYEAPSSIFGILDKFVASPKESAWKISSC